jgi:hypothetical protein
MPDLRMTPRFVYGPAIESETAIPSAARGASSLPTQ